MKKLTKSKKNRLLGGVAGGIAEYFNVDALLIRIAFIIISCFAGTGVLAYFLLYLLMPQPEDDNYTDFDDVNPINPTSMNTNNNDTNDPTTNKQRSHEGGVIGGFILLTLGILMLLRTTGVLHYSWSMIWRIFVPCILIMCGLGVLIKNRTLKMVSVVVMILIMIALLFVPNRYNNAYCNTMTTSVHAYGYDDDDDVSIDNNNNRASIDLSRKGDVANFNMSIGAATLKMSKTTKDLMEVYKNGDKFNTVKMDDLQGNQKSNLQIKSDNTEKVNLDVALNPDVQWRMTFDIGAAEATMDVSPFKVQELTLNVGAADTDITIGERTKKVKVEANVGAGAIKIRIPKASGCRAVIDTFLASKNLDGFSKTNGGYETSNYATANNTIIIQIDGAVSDVQILRY
ncbi:hypothetical protein FACS1894201_07350 [Bacteroidia bacterium]|nr:hypothetical protein FACS1894201_07350 [Bacteroidia bacterium]